MRAPIPLALWKNEGAAFDPAQALAGITNDHLRRLESTANWFVNPGFVTKYTALYLPVSTRFTFGRSFFGNIGLFQTIANLGGLEHIHSTFEPCAVDT